VTVCIALFRGINVGGKNALPMKALASLLEQLGHRSVRTYIQSGNAVFEAGRVGTATVARTVADAIEKRFGFRPGLVVLSARDLDRAIAANPFPAAAPRPTTLHASFLAEVPRHPDLDALERIRAKDERFALKNRVFYLHAPSGIGRSKLATRLEKSLGVAATARNWRTVLRLQEMAGAT
jgi:uncharacterized protein (DUF1697 family)